MRCHLEARHVKGSLLALVLLLGGIFTARERWGRNAVVPAAGTFELTVKESGRQTPAARSRGNLRRSPDQCRTGSPGQVSPHRSGGGSRGSGCGWPRRPRCACGALVHPVRRRVAGLCASWISWSTTDAPLRPFNLKLARASSVGGVVLDNQGKPVEGARIPRSGRSRPTGSRPPIHSDKTAGRTLKGNGAMIRSRFRRANSKSKSTIRNLPPSGGYCLGPSLVLTTTGRLPPGSFCNGGSP